MPATDPALTTTSSDTNGSTDALDELNLVNAGYLLDLYDAYRADPGAVDAEWRAYFDAGRGGFEPVAPPPRTTRGDGAASPALPAGATPIKGPAARLAQNMAASLSVPTATSYRDIDVAALEARRRELNAQIAPRKASFTHLVGWAIVQAAAEQRSMSHYYTTIDDQAYRVDPGRINLGLAVDVERPDGSRFLVVPVIKGADDMDFAGFHARYEDLVAKARTNKLGPDDYVGATITLTNPGTLGTTMSAPRLMPNQGTIVATGTIRDIGTDRRMTVSSTYDHRIIQGAESGLFLQRLEALLSGADGFYTDAFASLGATLAEQPPVTAPAVAPPVTVPGSSPASDAELRAVAAGMALVKAYRHFGHRAAHLDPLGSEPPGDPALDPGPLGLTDANMATIPAELMRIFVPGDTLAEALPHLRETYSGTIAYEVEHIGSHTERVWLRRVIESGEHRRPMEPDDRLALLERLVAVEGLERFLHRAYLGQKRFSIEGTDTLVPMLDVILSDAADHGARQVMIGMAHRGRLNVLAHVVGVSYEAILSEFEAGRAGTSKTAAPKGGASDDVKYHLGAEGSFLAADDAEVRVVLSPNPSHLEAVNPVIGGRTRAEQSDRSEPMVRLDAAICLPILIHGDAAFAAQGVVAETLNLARLAGYDTGGTIHIITNNQIGFTTGPSESRSTDYSSDLAKGFDIPIIHVNADDPEACLSAARLAMMYRQTFGNDVVIDLVGYRRYGHNEGDEPAYTQPRMYGIIGSHPTVRELYEAALVADGVIDKAAADAMVSTLQHDLAARQAAMRKGSEEAVLDRGSEALPPEVVGEPDTAVPLDALRDLNRSLDAVPDGFTIHPKLVKQFDRRATALDAANEAHVDWAHAELLAFGSLLREGTPIRLSGQDTVRGTFSQRHAGLFDARTGDRYVPLQHLPGSRASFELYNSPLSEYATLGFEYGYAVEAPEALVLWEAQYGDFVNGAEIIIDQFLVSGLAKWRQTSRLTLLLPHGYEGSGPEHSSARLERFLSLGAEGNIRVIYPTTPAQYFHLLRRQARHHDSRPLVVMTPKSLLRLPAAASRPSELTKGTFQSVLDDPRHGSAAKAAKVRRLLLCSGKIYYDLLASDAYEAASDLAIVRVERLYPFPADDLQAVIDRYPKIEAFAWVQEEPRNMGARKFVLPRIRHLVPYKIPLGDISRPERSRPAEGYPAAHAIEQARIVREALTGR